MTTIQILSDLHLIDVEEIKDLYAKGDVCVVAGDICEIDSQIDLYTTFLEWCSNNFELVVIISGNHEYYSIVNNIQDTDNIIINLVQKFDNIIFLQNDVYVYKNIRFIGCTLWSQIHKSVRVFKNLNDFRSIPNFNFNNYLKLFDNCVEFLNSIQRDENYVNIFITHHLPSHNLINDKYKGFGEVNTCYASNLDHLLYNADIWIFGHSHSSFDKILNGCRCISNPKGYGNENKEYDPEKIICV